MISRSPKASWGGSSSLHISMPPGMFIFQFYISQTNYNFIVSCYNFQWSFTSQWTEVSQKEDPSLKVHLATPLAYFENATKNRKRWANERAQKGTGGPCTGYWALVGHVLLEPGYKLPPLSIFPFMAKGSLVWHISDACAGFQMKTVSSFGTRIINKRKLWMKNSNSI